ncbi:MAG TPA: protoporphyrinogen oxidase, partial [Bryobacteraceae bacterium]|nr:protoporphyrinogen oxidase [Bryobacteraceae bacterium]
DQLIGCNEPLRGTHIWKGGRFIRMPEGMRLMVPSEMSTLLKSPLLSWPAKIRAGKDLLFKPKEVDERSVAEFVRDHFGQAALDYLAEPLLAGVYGGDPDKLSASAVLPQFVEWERKYGSLIRGARKQPVERKGPTFESLACGLGSLIDALVGQTKMEVIYAAPEKIEKGWRVKVNGAWIDASHVVVACPTEHVLPNLFPPVEYSSATVIALAYRAEDVPHPMNGFGFLVPSKERRTIAACTWVGSKWPNRVPVGKVLLRCFATENVGAVRSELKQMMGITAEPLLQRVYPWPKSMPQYTVGHGQRVEIVEGMLRDLPGLHVVGNAYHGVGMPDCVRMAKQVATTILTS